MSNLQFKVFNFLPKEYLYNLLDSKLYLLAILLLKINQ